MLPSYIMPEFKGVLRDMPTKNELERYNRQIMIKGIGEEGQEKLKQAKVFIAGIGGLGSPISIYLTAAGVGLIRLVDHDMVEPRWAKSGVHQAYRRARPKLPALWPLSSLGRRLSQEL